MEDGEHVPAATEPTVGELMSSDVVSIDDHAATGRARELMLGLGVHGLPVVDRRGSVVGIVTSADLVEEWPSGEPVSTIMRRRVVTIERSRPVSEAAGRMLEARLHHLVVTEQGRPTGILSSFDLLAVVAATSPAVGRRRWEFVADAGRTRHERGRSDRDGRKGER
ncbi:MAG: HPP family protein [Acidimicrobiales bacterium]